MDATETACGDRYVLQRYLDMAVSFGLLAVQASSHPGGDIHRDLSSHEIARLNGVERASAGGKKRRAIMSSSYTVRMLRGIIPLHGAHETTDCQLTRSSHLRQLRQEKVEEKNPTRPPGVGTAIGNRSGYGIQYS